ncbi:MAG: DUF4215 domain-containing protein, partial [Candidatus Peribacteraceae bacterium]|nr:DUF4215 domain-containing protein [Candidatus Peribacteraceae bacterium]
GDDSEGEDCCRQGTCPVKQPSSSGTTGGSQASVGGGANSSQAPDEIRGVCCETDFEWCYGEQMTQGECDWDSGYTGSAFIVPGADCSYCSWSEPQNATSSEATQSSTGGQPSSAAASSVGPFCGDGKVNGDEICDDGNENNDDACTSACKAPVCGDGFIQKSRGEECDNGNRNSDTAVGGCTTKCLVRKNFFVVCTQWFSSAVFGGTEEEEMKSAASDVATAPPAPSAETTAISNALGLGLGSTVEQIIWALGGALR